LLEREGKGRKGKEREGKGRKGKGREGNSWVSYHLPLFFFLPFASE
jgi:hypothetical protein